MNRWSAVKALVYKEWRITRLETLGILAFWPLFVVVICGKYPISDFDWRNAWTDFASVAPTYAAVISGVAAVLFALRDCFSDHTTREPVYFHTLPVDRRTYYGVKVGCGLVRYIFVAAIGLTIAATACSYFPSTDRIGWPAHVLFHIWTAVFYLGAALAAIRFCAHWTVRVAAVVGAATIAFAGFAFFEIMMEGQPSRIDIFATQSSLVAIVVGGAVFLAISSVARQRELS